MCRMILAAGRFDLEQVLRAAVRMSEGETAEHSGPIRRHPDGWGMVGWTRSHPDELWVHRSPAPLADSWHGVARQAPAPEFLAVHARHATRPTTRGAAYCHPVTRPGPEQLWLLMHNGYLPTVHQRLGQAASVFDTAELFDYIVPRTGFELDRNETLARLAALEPPGSAANAILVNARRAYGLTWWFADVRYPDYYRMFRADTATATYVSSERIAFLASLSQWQPLESGSLIEIPFGSKEQ
jgi:predicted glutamine amidotransferase